MILTPEQATVYRAGGRRYLSKRSAYMAIAREQYKAKYKKPRCYCVEDHEDAEAFDEEMERVSKRFARLMACYDRIRGEQC